MAKVMYCGEVLRAAGAAGVECDFVVRGETEEEVLQKGGQHAVEVHKMQPTPELVEMARQLIREE